MGISNANAALLFAAKSQGLRFQKTATIGKQTFWPTVSGLRYILPAFGINVDAGDLLHTMGSDGSKFIKYLGAETVEEFDASSYEHASVVFDMNTPLPRQWIEQFDLVYDGGSLEHIFDVRQALCNIRNMVKVGGAFVGSTAANNQLGHGFYQFSPELFFRVFSIENGWELICVLLCEHQAMPPRYWRVEDPKELGHRIEIQNPEQLYIMVIARKVESVKVYATPQQSDYFATWQKAAVPDQSAVEETGPTLQGQPPAEMANSILRISKKIYNRISRWRAAHIPIGRMTRNGLQQTGIREISLVEMSQIMTLGKHS